MAHTFTNLLVHLIFSTKGRTDLIADEIRADLFAYMGGIIRSLKGTALAVNGTRNHVHLLVLLPSDTSLSHLLRDVKANSSKWVHRKWPLRQRFSWQTGYAAFAVSDSNRDTVMSYIARQEEHHRKVTFDEEFLSILRKHNIPFDRRFVLD
jgi:putative transposase